MSENRRLPCGYSPNGPEVTRFGAEARRSSLILLDEPTEGLQPSIVQQLAEAFVSIRDRFGIALLLVEQNLNFAFETTTRGYVLERGTIVSEGDVDTLRDDALIKEYLAV